MNGFLPDVQCASELFLPCIVALCSQSKSRTVHLCFLTSPASNQRLGQYRHSIDSLTVFHVPGRPLLNWIDGEEMKAISRSVVVYQSISYPMGKLWMTECPFNTKRGSLVLYASMSHGQSPHSQPNQLGESFALEGLLTRHSGMLYRFGQNRRPLQSRASAEYRSSMRSWYMRQIDTAAPACVSWRLLLNCWAWFEGTGLKNQLEWGGYWFTKYATSLPGLPFS